MKKLRLDVGGLRVESFEAMIPADERGTVEGQGLGLPCTHPQVCPESRNWWCTGVCTCTQYAQYCVA